MATEDEKKRNLVKMLNLVLFGLAQGMWDLLGEASNAATRLIGETNIDMLQKDMGFEIAGEDVQDVLIELQRIFVDELGAMTKAGSKVEGDQVELTCTDCQLLSMSKQLLAADIQPYICPFRGMAVAAMEKNLGVRTRIVGTEIDPDKRVCVHTFEMIR